MRRGGCKSSALCLSEIFQNVLRVKPTGSEAQQVLAQSMRTPSPSPTRIPVPPTATPTRAAFALVTTLNGSGSADTQRITIPPGSVQIVVNYSDSPQAGRVSQAEIDYHNQVLTSWDNWYHSSLVPLQFALDDAARANDAVAIVRVTRQMNALKAQYDGEVSLENQRYADAVARARSQTTPTDIKVWINHVSTNSSDLIGA